MIISLNEQATASEGVLADDQSLVAYNNRPYYYNLL